MGKINLEYLILEVLEQELKGANEFLTAGKLGARCTALANNKGFDLNSSYPGASIKTRMAAVRQRGLEMGLVITSKRVRHFEEKDKKGNRIREKSLEIFGWKIADKNDEQFIIADLEIRRMLSNGNVSSLKSIVETAKMKSLISPADVKELLELNK